MSLWTDLMGHPFEMRQVDVKGVSTRAMVMGKGKGPPIIFLHGISGHLEAFIRTAPYHAEQFEVHLIDMLGHGYTDRPHVPVTIDRLAQHVVDYMDVNGLEKAHVAGISLGGWTTGWLLAKHADRMLRSTMVLPAGGPGMGTPEIVALVRNSTTAAVMSDDREFTRQRLAQVIHRKELLTEELVDVRYRIYHLPEFRAGLEDLLAVADLETYRKFMLTPELLDSIKEETLLVWSEEDAYSKVSGAQTFVDNIKRQKIAIFADAGHWPPYERPDDFAKVNMAFLKGGLAAVQNGVV